MKKLFFLIAMISGMSLMAQEYTTKISGILGTGENQRGKVTNIRFVPDTTMNKQLFYFTQIDSTYKAVKARQISLKEEVAAQLLLVSDTTITTAEMVKRLQVLQYKVDMLRNSIDEFNRWKSIKAERLKY